MKTLFFRFLLVLVSCIGFSACSQETSMERHIPNDAQIVLRLDAKRVATKMLFDQFGEIEWENLFGRNDPNQIPETDLDTLKKLWRQPSEMGINFLNEMFLTFHLASDSAEQIGTFYAAIDDPKKFQVFWTEKMPPSYRIKINEKSGFQYGFSDKKRFLVAWNKKFACFIFPLRQTEPADWEKHLTKILMLNENDILSKESNYQVLETGDNDFKIWLNLQKGTWRDWTDTEVVKQYPTPEEFEYGHMRLDFEKGKIDWKNQFFIEKESVKFYENILNRNNHLQVAENLPVEKVIALINLKYPQSVVQMFQQQSAMLLLQPFLFGGGVTSDQFVELFKGNALLALTEKIQTTKEITVYEFDEDFNKIERKKMDTVQTNGFVFGMSTDSSFQQLLVKYSENGTFEPRNDYYQFTQILSLPTFVRLKGTELTLTTYEEMFTKPTASNTHEISDLAQNYPISMYLDCRRFLADYPLKDQQRAVLEHFDKIIFKIPAIKGQILDANFEIGMRSKNENSLFYLLRNARKKPNLVQ